MKLDIDKKQFSDKLIGSLIARGELTVEHVTGRPSAGETAEVQRYHPDSRLSLYFYLSCPEAGETYLKLTLSGEAILPYLKVSAFTKQPLLVILSEVMKPLTHKYWVALKMICELNGISQKMQKVVCYQGEETEQVTHDDWILVMTHMAGLPTESESPNDAITNITMSHIKTMFLTLSEQALVSALRSEVLDEDVHQRIMSTYRKNVETTLKSKVTKA